MGKYGAVFVWRFTDEWKNVHVGHGDARHVLEGGRECYEDGAEEVLYGHGAVGIQHNECYSVGKERAGQGKGRMNSEND
jgi:hypothetical protein